MIDEKFELIYKDDHVIAMRKENIYYTMFDIYANKYLHEKYHETLKDDKHGIDGT